MFKCKMLKNILLRDRMLMTRLGLAIGSFLWGLQIFILGHQFSTKSPNGTVVEVCRIMELVAPSWVWGVLFFTHSAFAFYTLFSGRRSKITLVGDGFLGGLLWTTSTVAYYVAHWPVGIPQMSGTVVMAFYAWWHMTRFWAEDENHKLQCSTNT